MVDPVQAPAKEQAVSSVYKRVDELVALVNAEIQRQPLLDRWTIKLDHSAFNRDSNESRAALRAAIRFDDMPEYKAYVEGGRTTELRVERR